METLEQYKGKRKYIEDTKQYLKENPSVDVENIPERYKRDQMILRTIRYILDTPEGEDIIVRAEYVMLFLNEDVSEDE